ncbi:MAG: hypothetical protein LUF32_08370 [Clostridiales bacterium]|nr:hypothetical protein [Clostridiales bacterium]
MEQIYSLRIYDTELLRFSMEKQGLAGLVAQIRWVKAQENLLPLDMERTGEGVIRISTFRKNIWRRLNVVWRHGYGSFLLSPARNRKKQGRAG